MRKVFKQSETELVIVQEKEQETKKKTVYERDFERVCTSMYFGWNLNAPEETEKKNVINQERIMKTERERDRKL